MLRAFHALALAVVAAALALVSSIACGQVKNNGPMAIVLAYKSAPEKRVAFRDYMESQGVRQFEQWKKDGVFSNYQLFAASFAGQRIGNLDLVVILEFPSFVATERWKQIDRRMPGGLAPEALALGHVEHLTLVYSIGQSKAKQRDPGRAAYVLGLYEVLVDDASYIRYAHGYVEPQMKGWLDEGVLTAYNMYMSQPGQNPTAAPFTFLLLLEYKDMHALADSDAAKERVRHALDKIPTWKSLSEDKGSKRRARGFVIADAILPVR